MFKEAKWIWYDKIGTQNSFGEFYGSFSAKGNALCKISCDGDYTLFINGQVASSNQYGDFEHYKSVDEIDITPFLSEGENHIGILVWHFGKDSQRYKKYTPGVICEVCTEDGVVFATSENTLCRQSKAYLSGFERLISSQLGFSYSYNATKEDLWALGKGENMEKAYPVDKKCAFVPRPNKKLCYSELVEAKETYPQLYDLGREIVGLLSFEIEADEGTLFNVAYGEWEENGEIRSQMWDRNFSIDYVATQGKNTFTHHMLRFACRYLKVTSDKPVKINYIGIIPQFYPVTPKECTLEGKDKEIYDICLNTLKLSMMEHYVDCPWREQCLYAFDSRNQMLSGYYAFEGGNLDYVKSNLLLISKDRRSDGLLSICSPSGVDLTIPSFSLYYLISVKEYIEHSGDTKITEQVGDKLKEILNTFLQNTKDGLVYKHTGNCHWNFYDWSPHADGSLWNSEASVPNALITALTILGLKSYREICKLCTLPFEFSQNLEEISKRAKEEFFDFQSGLFLTEKGGHPTELVNALSVVAGLATQAESEKIAEYLSKKELISCSLSMKCFVYDALILTDKEKYKDFILNDIRANYSPMIATGTVWETVDGKDAFDGAGSLCHGWSSTPIYYYNILNS